jgi:hypothetical protein
MATNPDLLMVPLLKLNTLITMHRRTLRHCKVKHTMIQAEQKSMKSWFNRNHFVAPVLAVGHFVFLKGPPEHRGEPTKTHIKY